MNAPAQDIRDGGSVWVELSWQRDVLREKIDLSNLAALLVGLNNWDPRKSCNLSCKSGCFVK